MQQVYGAEDEYGVLDGEGGAQSGAGSGGLAEVGGPWLGGRHRVGM